jgi:hypothetical protein
MIRRLSNLKVLWIYLFGEAGSWLFTVDALQS